ncbi:MAG: hypothetical protein LBB38_03705 [Puniceicoccales bacterium]|jgi:hypothetical protein|nr:hypothetical protein [Puniceicoccales bacterium]
MCSGEHIPLANLCQLRHNRSVSVSPVSDSHGGGPVHTVEEAELEDISPFAIFAASVRRFCELVESLFSSSLKFNDNGAMQRTSMGFLDIDSSSREAAAHGIIAACRALADMPEEYRREALLHHVGGAPFLQLVFDVLYATDIHLDGETLNELRTAICQILAMARNVLNADDVRQIFTAHYAIGDYFGRHVPKGMEPLPINLLQAAVLDMCPIMRSDDETHGDASAAMRYDEGNDYDLRLRDGVRDLIRDKFSPAELQGFLRGCLTVGLTFRVRQGRCDHIYAAKEFFFGGTPPLLHDDVSERWEADVAAGRRKGELTLYGWAVLADGELRK